MQCLYVIDYYAIHDIKANGAEGFAQRPLQFNILFLGPNRPLSCTILHMLIKLQGHLAEVIHHVTSTTTAQACFC